MDIHRLKAGLAIVFKGHVFNYLSRDKGLRKKVREETIRKAVDGYLDSYKETISSVKEDACDSDEGDNCRIFSIWLQGEENAPEIVKACFRSIRHNCTQELVVLDAGTIWDWIGLPDYIRRKWEKGRIKPAHFADICRVELLYRYGGVWLDATAFVTSPLPGWLLDEDFFIYLSGDTLPGSYAFVQNCFFRARRHNYIVKVWRAAILEYWRREDSALDYFIHQMIFRKAVESNARAKEYFERMPHIVQDPTHELWWGYKDRPFDEKTFRQITSAAIFQKTEYKSSSAKHPVPGSFADVMMKMYL